jgi:hypothetical protein
MHAELWSNARLHQVNGVSVHRQAKAMAVAVPHIKPQRPLIVTTTYFEPLNFLKLVMYASVRPRVVYDDKSLVEVPIRSLKIERVKFGISFTKWGN